MKKGEYGKTEWAKDELVTVHNCGNKLGNYGAVYIDTATFG
jgi:hypothetical protein